MSTIGVLLVVGHSGVLSGIVRAALESDPAIDLRGELTEADDVADAVERSDADAVVMIATNAGHISAPADLLRRHPKLRVLAVEGDGRLGYLWQMRPVRAELGELSPGRLTSALHPSA